MAVHAHVVVATYEQAPHLARALRGYLRQTTLDFRLTVADDGSGPATAAVVGDFASEAAERGLRVGHVWHEDEGFRKNRILNETIRRDDGERLLIFSDGDCVPPAGFVAGHIEAHEPRSFHVAGAIRLDRATTERLTVADIDAGRHEGLATRADRRDLRRRARKSRWGTLLRRRHRPKVLGLNMAVDRALFEAVNGFDERFVGWGLGEDTDLRDRLMRLRPRPRVKVLYGRNDVVHLWHPVGEGGRRANRAYYDQPRPVRCERGLHPEGTAPAG